MSAYSEHADGLKELMDDLGENCPTLTWKGQTIRCLSSGLSSQSGNSIGGMSFDSSLTLTALVSDFAGVPKDNEPITYAGKKLRIESVTTSPGGLQYRLAVNDQNQGL